MTQQTRGGFTIEESARRLGNYRWASRRLFELLGRWVAEVPEAEVKLLLAAASRHHGWHAELLRERLPEVRELHPDRQTVPANAAVEALFDALAEQSGPDVTIGRLVGVYRVLVPHLIAVHQWHLSRCTPLADANVIRTLGFVLGDEIDDWRSAEGWLQTTADEHVLVEADAVRIRVERLLVVSGGISGVGTMVEPSDTVGCSSSGPIDVDG